MVWAYRFSTVALREQRARNPDMHTEVSCRWTGLSGRVLHPLGMQMNQAAELNTTVNGL